MITLTGKIEEGKLIYNEDELYAISHKLDGKTVDVVIKEQKNTRSNAQNKLYWSYLSLIEQETGNHRDDMHEFFKRWFLSAQQITCFGIPIMIPGSTATLDTKEFTEYLKQIEQRSGVPIPNIWMDEYENSIAM